ncbi:MAG: hypothetical protein SF123_07630 [Chloroflexota bacterium]|nr:hypothetical protein [Chloroflexota bacterium]
MHISLAQFLAGECCADQVAYLAKGCQPYSMITLVHKHESLSSTPGEILITTANGNEFRFPPNEAPNIAIYLQPVDAIAPEEPPAILPCDDGNPDAASIRVLRKSIIDFMSLAEDLGLLHQGLNVALKQQSHLTRYQARHVRLRHACALQPDESWRAAQLRYEAE